MKTPQCDDQTWSALSSSFERERAEWERQRQKEMQAIMEMKRALADSWLALETEQRALRSRQIVSAQSRSIDEIGGAVVSDSGNSPLVEAKDSEVVAYQAPTNSAPTQDYEECVLDAITKRRRNPPELFQLLREETWRRQT